MHRVLAGGFAATILLVLAVPMMASTPARSQGLPDLTADGWLDHEPVVEGYPYLLTLAVKNLGDAPAGNFTVLMQYSGYGGPDLLQIPASNPLRPGETRAVRQSNFTGSQGTVGFGISVDYYGTVSESDEANNQVNRVWDGLHPAERPISRTAVLGNGIQTIFLPSESAKIYNATLRRNDRLRYHISGDRPTQPFDVLLFFGEANLNTYFGFGGLSPEREHRGIVLAQGEFQATRTDFAYLVVDNLSDQPYPPWPQLLNVTVTIEIERAPPATGQGGPTSLSAPWSLGILVAAVAGTAAAVAIVVALDRRGRRTR